MREEIRMRRKTCPSLLKGDTQQAVSSPNRTRTRLPSSHREFPTPGQRLCRTAASRTSPAAAAALGEVTAKPAERLRKEDAPGAPGSPRQRGMKESPAPRRSGKRSVPAPAARKTRTPQTPFAAAVPPPTLLPSRFSVPSPRDAMPPAVRASLPVHAHPPRRIRYTGRGGGGTRRGGPAAAPQTPARPSRALPGGEHPAAALTLDGQPAGAEHTCYQSGHIPNHSTTGPRCAASSARRAARPGRGGAGPGWLWPGRARRGWRGRRGGSGPAARRCAHARAHPRAAPHLRSAARCSLACAL